MIFEKVTQLTSKEEFIEKILVYIRLVEVVAERNGIKIPTVSAPSEEMIAEMSDMGLIDESDDVKGLKKIASVYYVRFLSALSFYLFHKEYPDPLY